MGADRIGGAIAGKSVKMMVVGRGNTVILGCSRAEAVVIVV